MIFRQQTDGQSLELSCSPQLQRGAPTGLHLYHRGARSQTTLLSMAEGGGGPRLNAEHVGRLRLAGGLDSRQVNVTVALLQPSDTGLYVWELSYGRGNRSEQMVLGAPTVFLLVEGAGTWLRHLAIHSAVVKPRVAPCRLKCASMCVCVFGAGGSCRCSASYPLLLLIIFTVAGLLLLTLGLLALEKCVSV